MRRETLLGPLILAAALAVPAAAGAQAPVPAEPAPPESAKLTLTVRSVDPSGVLAGER